MLYDSTPRPIRSIDITWVVKKDCSFLEVSNLKKHYQYNASEKFVSIVGQSFVKNKAAKEFKKIFPVEIALDMGTILNLHTAQDIRQSKFFNNEVVTLSDDNDDEPISYSLSVTEAPLLRRYNRYKNKVEELRGVEIKTLNNVVGLRRYSSEDSSYEIEELFSVGESVFTEYLTKDEWLNSEREDKKNSSKSIGFQQSDFSQTSLRYEVLTDGPIKLFNPSSYFKVEEQKIAHNYSRTVLKVEKIFIPPSVRWTTAPTVEDKKYLQGSKYIQLDKVQSIAEELRPQLKNLSRLQASVLIIKKVLTLMTYDHASLDDGLIDAKGTEEILKSKVGVCQHFSVLFTSIARALNIPTRIISGYSIEENLLINHSWVEIKVNNSIWWPLDAQIEKDRLPSLNYFPLQQTTFYEAMTDKTLLDYTVSELEEKNLEDKGYLNIIFKKLPNH